MDRPPRDAWSSAARNCGWLGYLAPLRRRLAPAQAQGVPFEDLEETGEDD